MYAIEIGNSGIDNSRCRQLIYPSPKSIADKNAVINDSGCLSNAQIERLNYPFSSIYTKLFATFDKSVIMQCQFFTGQLPLKDVIDLKFLNLINGLRLLFE